MVCMYIHIVHNNNTATYMYYCIYSTGGIYMYENQNIATPTFSDEMDVFCWVSSCTLPSNSATTAAWQYTGGQHSTSILRWLRTEYALVVIPPLRFIHNVYVICIITSRYIHSNSWQCSLDFQALSFALRGELCRFSAALVLSPSLSLSCPSLPSPSSHWWTSGRHSLAPCGQCVYHSPPQPAGHV